MGHGLSLMAAFDPILPLSLCVMTQHFLHRSGG